MLVRWYRDTEAWGDAVAPSIDCHGRARCSQNRSVDRMLERATAFRGAPGGVAAPLHLRNALEHACREPRNVDEYASLCGVKASTAWNYACRVVERWPRAHAVVRGLVHGDVLDAVRGADDLSGSLGALMRRLSPALSGSTEVRCLSDRYAHLRLARLCVEAERAENFSSTPSQS